MKAHEALLLTENIQKLFERMYETEREAIGQGVFDSIDESTPLPSLWLSLQPLHDLSLLIERCASIPSLEPYNQLAGLLAFLLRSTLPKELQLQGCSIQTKDKLFRFCISGSIFSDDLQICLERYINPVHH